MEMSPWVPFRQWVRRAMSCLDDFEIFRICRRPADLMTERGWSPVWTR